MYKYFTAGNKVICISSYAGKNLRGVAKCAPDDEFDYLLGCQLARARCDKKIAKKRATNAATLCIEAFDKYKAYERRYKAMASYRDEAFATYEETQMALEELEGKIYNP